MDSDLYWTREQMRRQLGTSDATLAELTYRRDNPLPSFRLGRRVLYPKDRVREWVNANPAGVAPLRVVA